MSHFYGSVRGNRGGATRGGSKRSGFDTVAASFDGAITVRLYHDEDSGEDRFCVQQGRWHGSGIDEIIAEGVVGKPQD